MKINRETKWMCENSRVLEKYSGKWVIVNVNEGVVSSGKSLNAVLRSSKIKGPTLTPFVFHVPSKDKLDWIQPVKK